MIARGKVGVMAVLMLAAVVLRRFPPEGSRFYPLCPIHSAFGVQCPGCGGTRAAAALLRGDVSAALHDNALITVLLPLMAGYLAVCCWRWACGEEMQWPQTPPALLWGVATVAFLFTVVRNLPLR